MSLPQAKAKAQAKGLVAAVAIKQAKDQEAAVAEASKKAEAVTTCVELSRSFRKRPPHLIHYPHRLLLRRPKHK